VINFEQVEPEAFAVELLEEDHSFRRESITTSPYFNVERLIFSEKELRFTGRCDGATFEIWGTVSGRSQIFCGSQTLDLPAIRFALLPAIVGDYELKVTEPTVLLRVYVPE
jgi:mannose-6-phosphate isomerase